MYGPDEQKQYKHDNGAYPPRIPTLHRKMGLTSFEPLIIAEAFPTISEQSPNPHADYGAFRHLP